MIIDNGYFYIVIVIGLLFVCIFYFQGMLLYMNYVPEGSNRVRRIRIYHSYLFQLYSVYPIYYNLHFQDVWITTEDGFKINCWFIFKGAKPSGTDPTIVYFHGNAGNMSQRMDIIKNFLDEIDCNIFLVSYRGYGKSEGTSSQRGLRLDARAVYNHLKSRTDIDRRRIFIFGRSLGGAVAIHLAQELKEEDVAGFIIENTFTSVLDMIDITVPLFKYFKMFCTERWESLKAIKVTKDIPFLFLAGEKDEIVPHTMMQELVEACKSTQKDVKVFQNGRHNLTWREEGYTEEIREWIKKILEDRSYGEREISNEEEDDE